MPDNLNPLPVSDAAFERLKQSCSDLASSPIPEQSYQWMVGKTLRVATGTYAGFQGECTDIVKAHAVLKLEMFKSEIPVPIPVECFDPEVIRVQQEATKEIVDHVPTKRYKSLIKNSAA